MNFIEIISSGSRSFSIVETHMDKIEIDSLPIRLTCGNNQSNFEEFRPTNLKKRNDLSI